VGAGTVDGAVRVAVVEDHAVVMDGVRSWIAADPAQRAVLVAGGTTIEEVISGAGGNADVVVLDLELGGPEAGGSLVTDRVAGLCDQGFRVVVFSVHVEPMIVETVLRAGASVFLDKRTERRQFVDTVVAVGHDLPFVTPSMAGGMLHAVRLSERERQALQHWFQGMDHDSIARRLTKSDGTAISAATVKQYIERARAKFAAAGRPCRSQFALLARCIELGLIRPEEIEDYRSGDYADDQPRRPS
jgi:two-component system nitrate/nitrite response regulator NarL